MGITNTSHIKTDKRDAANIARCLAFRSYTEVFIPTKEDESVKDYIRMRDDHQKILKAIKQQILALVFRHGSVYDGGKNYWTGKHLTWLKSLEMDDSTLQNSLEEYLLTYTCLSDKIERFDNQIEEIAMRESYAERVKKLECLIGIRTHTALATIVEIGDFNRFENPKNLSAYLGLVPGEDSSNGKHHRLSITKAGNSHVRRLLVEAAQSYTRGTIGFKSKALKQRQSGNLPQVIAYADKANERMRRKYYRLTLKNNVKRNVAVTAIARELSCFIWGLMTTCVT